MKRRSWRWLLAALLLGAILLGDWQSPVSARQTLPLSGTTPSQALVSGIVLVRPRPGADQARILDSARALAAPVPVTRLGIVKIRVAPGQEEAAAARLRQSGLVDYASPDYVRHVAVIPDDPNYPEQWALPKVDAPTAWDTTLGSPNVVVAVIDSGYDFSHPDRPVHLIAGKTLVSYPNSKCPPEMPNDPQDDEGHGTEVGGIIGADFNNGLGVAGLAPGVSILVIKAADCTGNLADSDIAQAIDYAADSGAKVINMSFGGPSPDPILDQAVQYAWGKGAVLVAAAGNDGSSQPFYPASIPDVMAVAATDQNDAVAAFSNRGSDITVAAPGVNIWSTVPTFVTSTGYVAESGTSMAAPHVAAIAGLVRSTAPSLTNAQVVQAIERGAVAVGAGCPNASVGYGRVDAAGALSAARSIAGAKRQAASNPPYRIFLPTVANGACSSP